MPFPWRRAGWFPVSPKEKTGTEPYCPCCPVGLLLDLSPSSECTCSAVPQNTEETGAH